MPTRIAEYYNELQRREGLDPVELVAEWAQPDTDAISAAFRNALAAAQRPQQTKQSDVGRSSSEGDEGDLCELDKIVGRPWNLRLAGERRRVPDDEEHDRRKRTEDRRRDGEAHQHEHEGLSKAEVKTKQRREHAVEERIAESGRQNGEREFQEVVAGLKRRAPVPSTSRTMTPLMPRSFRRAATERVTCRRRETSIASGWKPTNPLSPK